MEESVGQKQNHREFALASVAELSLPASSASPGIARFTSDGVLAQLQIHEDSQKIALDVDLRTAQVRFRF